MARDPYDPAEANRREFASRNKLVRQVAGDPKETRSFWDLQEQLVVKIASGCHRFSPSGVLTGACWGTHPTRSIEGEVRQIDASGPSRSTSESMLV